MVVVVLMLNLVMVIDVVEGVMKVPAVQCSSITFVWYIGR